MSNDNKTDPRQSDLLKFAADKRITRRNFMQYAAALGITATAATSLWSEQAMAAPKRGGHLRIGSEGGSNTDTCDPRRTFGANQPSVSIISVYDTMTYLDAKGQPVPQLCTEWESSPDAVTWRFKIRKGVEFHNGKTLTPADVIASYNYEDDDANGHGDSRSTMASITEKKIDGDWVVLTLEAPNADLPVQLSSYGLLIGPEGTEGEQWNEQRGTGPYKIKDFNQGVRFSLERNENHYRSDEGWFDSAEILNIQDQASRSNALRTGEVDIINRPDPKTTALLAKVPGIKVEEIPGNQHYTMPMRMDTDPYTNLHVRQALKHAVDRRAILDKILRGYGYLGNDHPIGKGQTYFNKDLPQRELDPDKAKWHVQQSGLGKLSVELHAADTAWVGAVDAAQLIQEGAKKAGIEIKPIRAAEDGYWSDIWMQKPWCLSYWGGRPTENWMFSTSYWGPSNWNETFMQHERFDKILLLARGELNADLRREMYYEMQEILYNEGGSVIPVFSSYVNAMADKLQHGDVSGTYDLDTFRIVRNYWFA